MTNSEREPEGAGDQVLGSPADLAARAPFPGASSTDEPATVAEPSSPESTGDEGIDTALQRVREAVGPHEHIETGSELNRVLQARLSDLSR